MTQDEIMEMARQAGKNLETSEEGYRLWTYEALEAFAKLAVEKEREEFAVHAVDIARRAIAEEREACAKVALAYDSQPWSHVPASAHVADMVSISIGKAIRARGQA